MKNQFELKILNQSWIDGSKSQNNEDLCSHGNIFLKVKDIILSDKNDDTWGINETALALLRSVFGMEDKNRTDEKNRIFYHGCSYLMDSCPITLNWKVIKEGERIILSNFEKVGDTSAKPIIYKNLKVILNFFDYAQAVYNFAKTSKDFFENNKITFSDEFERRTFKEFWEEYNNLFFNLEKMLKKSPDKLV